MFGKDMQQSHLVNKENNRIDYTRKQRQILGNKLVIGEEPGISLLGTLQETPSQGPFTIHQFRLPLHIAIGNSRLRR